MLAFIVNQFPRQVDAYFLRELRGLLESGLDFGIYSLLPAPKGWKIHEDARPLLERTIYPPAPTALGGQTLAQLARHPAQTAGIAARVAAGHRSMPAALAKSMAILPQSLAFAREMQERGVRHIHANWATYPATAAMVISELTGLPYSFSGHATDIFVHHAMLREKIEAAQFVITCTKFNRTYLAEIAPEHADRIRTVYHGVDLPAFAPTGAPRHPRLVLSAGTLRTCKGYDDLIRAIGLLRDRGSDAELEIVRRRRRAKRSRESDQLPESRGPGAPPRLSPARGTDPRVSNRSGRGPARAPRGSFRHPEHLDRRTGRGRAGGLHRTPVARRTRGARRQWPVRTRA